MTRASRRARSWTRWALLDSLGEVCGVGVHRMIPYKPMGYAVARVRIQEILPAPRTRRRRKKHHD